MVKDVISAYLSRAANMVTAMNPSSVSANKAGMASFVLILFADPIVTQPEVSAKHLASVVVSWAGLVRPVRLASHCQDVSMDTATNR